MARSQIISRTSNVYLTIFRTHISTKDIFNPLILHLPYTCCGGFLSSHWHWNSQRIDFDYIRHKREEEYKVYTYFDKKESCANTRLLFFEEKLLHRRVLY